MSLLSDASSPKLCWKIPYIKGLVTYVVFYENGEILCFPGVTRTKLGNKTKS